MESAKLDAYLFFTGNCREAMTFYQEVFGGELTLSEVPEDPNKHIMHARLSGGLIPLMASDGTRTEPYGDSLISLSISGTDDTKLREVFDQLSAGGKVTSPLKKELWGDIFGTLTDKFDVDWMINISQPQAATAEK